MAVFTEPVPHHPLLRRPRWLRPPRVAGRARVALALLVLAIVAAAVAGAAWLLLREPGPRFPLRATGLVPVTTAWNPATMVRDGEAGFWVVGAASLARLKRTATVEDARYAPDGDLWVVGTERGWYSASTRYAVARRHDGAWTVWDCDAARDGAGRGAGDGAAFPCPAEDAMVPRSHHRLAFADDGTVWLALNGLARFADGRWTAMATGVPLANPAVAPDGSVWALATESVVRYDPGG